MMFFLSGQAAAFVQASGRDAPKIHRDVVFEDMGAEEDAFFVKDRGARKCAQ